MGLEARRAKKKEIRHARPQEIGRDKQDRLRELEKKKEEARSRKRKKRSLIHPKVQQPKRRGRAKGRHEEGGAGAASEKLEKHHVLSIPKRGKKTEKAESKEGLFA